MVEISRVEELEQIHYGLRNGRLVHVSEVARGLASECICVACKNPLVAKKGYMRKHHFAHASNSDCRGAPETALHILSKELFRKIHQFNIPSYVFYKERKTKSGKVVKHNQLVAKGGAVLIDDVRIEAAEVGFIPDIVVLSGLKELIIEIAITHKVDRNKLRHIRRRGLPAIEIRLDTHDAFLTKDQLRDKLCDDLKSKMWLFHPDQRDAERKFFKQLREARKPSETTKTRIVPSKSTKPHPRITRQLLSGFSEEYEKTGYAFFVTHGRWPNMEECLKLWPHLWKKPS